MCDISTVTCNATGLIIVPKNVYDSDEGRGEICDDSGRETCDSTRGDTYDSSPEHSDSFESHDPKTHYPEPALIEESELDEVGSLSFSPPPMKHSDTRDSISSIDSDVSLSYDHPPTSPINIHNPQKRPSNDSQMGDLSDSASDTGSAGGKDSGCEVTHENPDQLYEAPSEDLADKIVAQVEFYFSDVNITKDAFLLKHVKRNKEGYVSLKLISSFKRVKHLTKDWRVVAAALSRSKKLEINEAGTKLRRVDPLPQYDQTAPSRTVVAVNMPIEKPTIENVAEIFSRCGEIALIRVLRPGNPVPADVRQFINKNPSLNGLVCALVEFTDSAYARKAIELQKEEFPGFTTRMKVYELNNVPNQDKKKRNSQTKKSQQIAAAARLMMNSADMYDYSSCASGSDAEYEYRLRYGMDPRARMRRGSSAHFPIRPAEPTTWLQRRLSAASCSSGSDYGYMYMPRRLSASSRDSGSDNNMMFLSRRFSNCSVSSSDYGGCGFRRMSSCSQASDFSGPRSRSNSAAFHLPENVVRMPQGPDGSKGFRQRLINPSH